MNRVSRLIEQSMPQGVPFAALGDVIRIASDRIDPAKLDATNYVGVDNLISNFGGRKDSEYGANSSGAIGFHPGDVLLGNIRPYLRKVWLADRDGGASPDVLTLSLLPAARATLLPRFLYFLIASEPFIDYMMQHARGAKMPRGDKVAILNYRVPVPPLDVQRSVVEILDKFTRLEADLRAELEAELQARRLQHAYYLDSLVSRASAGAPWTQLGRIAAVRVGQAPTEGVLRDDGPYPFINAGRATESGRASRSNTSGGTITIPSRGQGGVGVVGYQPNDFWCGPLCYRIASSDPRITNRFLYYYLKSVQPAIRGLQQTGGTPALNRKELILVPVPIPDLDKQERAVNLLETLDTLIDEVSISLPAELSYRASQYAHYRDKLLTFREAA